MKILKSKLLAVLTITVIMLQIPNIVLARDAFTLTYSPNLYNNTWLLNRMNCYGYALQVYYRGTATSVYKQQPGEFGYNSEPFANLMNSYNNSFYYWHNQYQFIKDRIGEDMYSLGYWVDETYETGTIAQEKQYGYRKIALVYGNDDYHFYAQNEDGTWSHKPGSTAVKNTSLTSNQLLTNQNIYYLANEGIYYSKPTFFRITKDAVVDYPHGYGQGQSQYTSTNFADEAPDNLASAYYSQLHSGTNYLNFDNSMDIDYFRFIPTESKYYNISTSSAGGEDIDGKLFDEYGNVIYQDMSASDFSAYYYLKANTIYYFVLYDYRGTTNSYTMNIY